MIPDSYYCETDSSDEPICLIASSDREAIVEAIVRHGVHLMVVYRENDEDFTLVTLWERNPS